MKFGLEQHIIDIFIAVFEQFPKVDKALMFGSRAKGTYRPDSDIDIAIKGQDITTDDIIAMSVAFEEQGIAHSIDLICYHTITEPALVEHIDRVGVEFYSRWKEYKFSELLIDESISYGIVQPGTHTEIDSVPIIRVNNIKNGHILTDEIMKVSSSIEAKYLRTRLVGGELLITVVGSVGECAIVPETLKGWNVARAVSVARIKSMFNVKYIKYAFKTDDIIFQMYGNTNDTVQPTLNLSLLKELRFILPSLSEQTAIASILCSLDDKIDLLQRQNKTLEKLAETLFRQWFVEEAEESWEIGKLSDEFNFIMGQSPLGSELNEEKIGLIFYQGRSDFGFRFPTPRIYTTAPTRLAKPLDTLVSVRAPVGDMNMAYEECCLGRGVAAFRYKHNDQFYSYTYYKLRSLMEPIKQFEDNGSVFGSIGRDDFKEIKNIIPPKNLIIQFQEIAKPIDDKIILNEHQIRTLTQTRDTLLPKLMSGEVRVKLSELG